MKIKEIKETLEIPEGVTVTIEGTTIKATGPAGEAQRKWKDPRVLVNIEGTNVIVLSKNASKNQKRELYTTVAHIRNIITGVKTANEYKLKICASHFPMQVSLEGTIFIVKNFFGEKVPRKTELPKEVEIKIQGDIITITGADIEKVGIAASKMEQVCRITNRDRRIFQDGIYITERNGVGI